MKPELAPQQRMHIFMLYPNAEILHEGKYYILDGIDIGDCTLDLYRKETNNYNLSVPVKYCQLKLFGLDQITEEHKRELAVIMEWKEAEIDKGRLWLSDEPENGYPIMIFHMLNELPYPAADFLRKHNYAIDYEGIDLFEAGVAVKIK
jgi:hypothetical protein